MPATQAVQPPNLKLMSDVSMLTILIQASAIIKNQGGDSSIHGYVETQETISPNSTSLNFSTDADFASLNCLSDILVQDTQILAACYDNTSSFTLLTNSESDLELGSEFLDMEFPPHESVESTITAKAINAAVVPNANDRRAQKSNQSSGLLGNIRKVEGGKSLWTAGEQDDLHHVLSMNISTPEGLANHAESVSCYLYEYGRTRDKVLRTTYSKSFFLYLLGASWKKIYSRFRSWRALSFIKELEDAITTGVFANHVMDIGNNYGPVEPPQELGPGDRTLASFFSQNKAYLFPMITFASKNLPASIWSQMSTQAKMSSSESENVIVEIFNAFGKAAELAVDQKMALYTKETALIFHYLLYLSFLMTGKALHEIGESHQLNSKSPDYNKRVGHYKDAISAAELPVRFLICLLSSRAFRVHMRVWTNEASCLNTILPRFDDKSKYIAFAMERGLWPASKLGPQSQPEADSEDDEDDVTQFPEGSRSLAMFHRWATIFIAHFLAKRTLEYQSARIFESSPDGFKKPNIKIFAVTSEEYSVPDWDQFKRVIREAFTDTDSDIGAVNYIISILEDRVKTGFGLRPDAQRSLATFKRIMEGNMKTYTLRMHCEAVLAALLDASRRAQSESSTDTDTDLEALANFYKTLENDMVSVSMLCCPVCWELFKVLDLGVKINGCHPTVTPLALPETLSPEILSKMVNSLRAQLTSQLVHLLDSNRVRSTQHLRNASETGHSASSSNEGSSKFPKAFEVWRKASGNSMATPWNGAQII